MKKSIGLSIVALSVVALTGCASQGVGGVPYANVSENTATNATNNSVSNDANNTTNNTVSVESNNETTNVTSNVVSNKPKKTTTSQSKPVAKAVTKPASKPVQKSATHTYTPPKTTTSNVPNTTTTKSSSTTTKKVAPTTTVPKKPVFNAAYYGNPLALGGNLNASGATWSYDSQKSYEVGLANQAGYSHYSTTTVPVHATNGKVYYLGEVIFEKNNVLVSQNFVINHSVVAHSFDGFKSAFLSAGGTTSEWNNMSGYFQMI